DDHAPSDASEGCDASDVTADTAGITFTCVASSAGGSTTQSVTLKRDATPPQLTFGAPSPAANGVGWYNGDVTFAFDATDGTSGVAGTSGPSPVVVDGYGPGQSAPVTV